MGLTVVCINMSSIKDAYDILTLIPKSTESPSTQPQEIVNSINKNKMLLICSINIYRSLRLCHLQTFSEIRLALLNKSLKAEMSCFQHIILRIIDIVENKFEDIH